MSYVLALVKVALATHLTIDGLHVQPQRAETSAPSAIFGWRDKYDVTPGRHGVCEELRQGVGVHTAWKKPDTELIPARDRLLFSRNMVRMEVGLIMASF